MLTRSSTSSPKDYSYYSGHSTQDTNRKIQCASDFALYCERNLVERFFNQLKHFRAIATRYDKLARNFLAGVQLAAITILLN